MEHELEALKVEFVEYKTKQENNFKTEVDSLKELIRDLQGDVGEIMSMHDGQEEDLNSSLDRHRLDINQLREDHNSLREEYQELEAEAAALRIRISNMQDRLCHCSDRRNPPISAVSSPSLPAIPASPEYSQYRSLFSWYGFLGSLNSRTNSNSPSCHFSSSFI